MAIHVFKPGRPSVGVGTPRGPARVAAGARRPGVVGSEVVAGGCGGRPFTHLYMGGS